MLLKLVSKKPETNDIITWIFESNTPLSPVAGQYFHYLLPHADPDNRGVERWFTNSAAPSENRIQISTRIDSVRGSSFKRALNALTIGQEIEADGPEGNFTIDDFSKHYIFVAGGIGITPFRSILVEAKLRNFPLKATVLYGNRTNDIAFKSELDGITSANQSVVVKYIIEPERITSELIKKHIDDQQSPAVYLSGPEPMVKSLANELKQMGVSENIINVDDFPGYEGI